MKYFLSMAALALVGAMTVSCSSDDNIIEQPQQPETKNNVVTLTTTVGLGGSNGTRALDASGHKTFATGETMAVIYNNGTSTVKAVSHALEASDITDDGKKATFTFDLETPNKSADVTYIYPAAMAKADGTVNYAALNSQDGTLSTLSSNLDYCTKSGPWDGGNLPTLTLENQLAILAVTLKNEAGTSEITGSITDLTLSDGTNTYNVTREAVAGPIYVAIRPTTSATITVTTTVGTKSYKKTLIGKTYAKGNGYPVSWTMAKVVDYSAEINVPAGEHWYISGVDEHNITIGDDATVTIGGYLHMQNASIICSGNATIILADGTDVNIFDGRIKAGPENTTLTIKGNTGELNIQAGNSLGAAIGASDGDACGNIVIEGGIITAKGAMAAGIGASDGAACGNITISGGTVTATGSYGAGIGASTAACGNITISGGTVTATGSNGAGIGASNAECGNITISGGTVTATGDNNGGAGIGSGASDNGWCGDITISGGTVTATGGFKSAGIGTGEDNGCGNITIKSTVTSVTATKGSGASASIGAAANDEDSPCGTVTIDGVANATTSSTFTNFNSSVSGNTWTLTHK